MFKNSQKKVYQNKVIGTWGTFQSSGGRVEYISTKAKLGGPETANERRLTSLLRPVREILPVASLDFGQLLQRDLDDHRVATSLIPYLLKGEGNMPAFFPPIVAVLLPFVVDQPAKFESESPIATVDWLGVSAQERRSGDAYRSLKHLNEDGGLHETQLGSLEWNEERGKLVVLDGQHRAMALLAIYRTITKTWKATSAEKYSHFYESTVEALVKLNKLNLENVEVPVSVCWFPDLAGREMETHKAARKLFVDLNREARAPSEARLTLLSDSELVSIFARSLLNTFRAKKELSLYSIDYDNPEQDSGKVARWSAVTNLECLKAAARYLVFGPGKMLDDVSSKISSGKAPLKAMDEFMRVQLDVMNHYQQSIDDGGRIISRSDLGNTNFPRSLSPNALEVQFEKSWGAAITKLLGGIIPFKAHDNAIIELAGGWVAPDGASSLAKEALFDGVGMYWTLRSSEEYYTEKVAEAKAAKSQIPHKGDVVNAWGLVQPGGAKHTEFKLLRAERYFETKAKSALVESEKAFAVFSTSACQLGMFLAFGTLARKCCVPVNEVGDFAEILRDAWNAALNSRVQNKSRKVIFNKDVKHPINMLGKLDASLCVYFRYLWLELLCVKEATESINAADAPASLMVELKIQTESARKFYAAYLVSEESKAQRQVTPGAKPVEIAAKANEVVLRKLSDALKAWFELPVNETVSWWKSCGAAVEDGSATIGDNDDSGAGGDEADGSFDLQEQNLADEHESTEVLSTNDAE